MAKQQQKHPGKGWYTKQQMAELLNVTEQHFDRSLRQYAPADGQKTIDRRIYFHARALIDGWIKSQIEATKQQTGETEPAMQGTETPALEEWRKIKAQQERIRLAEMEGSMIPLASLEPALTQLASILRQAGDQLQRQHGDLAAEVLNLAVTEAENVWEKLFANDPAGTPDAPSPEADGKPRADAKAKKHAGVRRAGNHRPKRAVS